MKKDDHVEFTGLLPKELQGKNVKKPIYGTVLKVKGSRITVKPRYKRFNVVVAMADLTEVDYEKFHKSRKAKKKPAAKKTPTKKVTVKGDGPVKVVTKPGTMKAEVEKKIQKGDKATATKPKRKPAVLKKSAPKNEGIVKAVAKAKYPDAEAESKPKYIVGIDPATDDAKPVAFKIDKDNIEQVPLDDVKKPVEIVAEGEPKFPLNEESLKDFEKKEPKKPYDWVQEEPVNETPDAKPTVTYEEEATTGKEAIVWTVIVVLVGLAVTAYFTLR
jgi:hypothetical protein